MHCAVGIYRKSSIYQTDNFQFERNERLNNYGTYGAWRELYKANKGAALVLPETLGKVWLIAAPAAADGETLYTVKAGDTLGTIAKATYGDMMKYKTIFERNADRLVNANTIYEGQVIVLPAK